MATRKRGDPDHIRYLNDGLVDGQGLRWDRIFVAESDGFYLSPEEAAPYIDSSSRFVNADGVGSRARVIERDEFLRLARDSEDYSVQAFRASDGSGRTMVLLDLSNC